MSPSRHHDTNVDSAVADAYRQGAREQAPADLNRSVLAAAGKEIRRQRGMRWRATWYRPISLAATVGLAFALVLHLNDPALSPTAVEDLSGGTRVVTPGAFEDAGRATEQQIRELQDRSGRPISPAMTEPEPVAQSPARDTDNLPPATGQCSDDARSSATTWWQCIQDLEKNGLTEAAERELQALLRTHPQFAFPE